MKSGYEPSDPSGRSLSQICAALKRLGIFLGGMLVHPKVTPSVKFAGTHLYISVGGERHSKSIASSLRTPQNFPGPAGSNLDR